MLAYSDHICVLLRLPSEALPIVRGGIGLADNGEQVRCIWQWRTVLEACQME